MTEKMMVEKKFPGSDADGDFDDKETMKEDKKEKKKSRLSKFYKDHKE